MINAAAEDATQAAPPGSHYRAGASAPPCHASRPAPSPKTTKRHVMQMEWVDAKFENYSP